MIFFLRSLNRQPKIRIKICLINTKLRALLWVVTFILFLFKNYFLISKGLYNYNLTVNYVISIHFETTSPRWILYF